MAVQAISNVASKGYSNISFGKRGEKTAKNSKIASPLKAVPLAVLVAMSPLNTTNAENIMRSEYNHNFIELAQSPQPPKNYIEAKGFKGKEGSYTVGVVRDNNGKNKIWVDYIPYDVSWSHELGMSGYLSNFNKVQYKVLDDTNKEIDTFKYDQAYVKDLEGRENYTDGITNQDVCDYIKDLLSRYEANIIPQNRNYSLKMTRSGELRHIPVSTNWIEEAKNKGQAWGTPVKSAEIATSDGKFTITLHNIDDNKNNFEQISIQKEGGPRLQVDALVSGRASIASRDQAIKDIDLYQINVSQKYVGAFSIYNKELWNILFQLYNASDNNNAFIGAEVEYFYSSSDSKGRLSDGVSYNT